MCGSSINTFASLRSSAPTASRTSRFRTTRPGPLMRVPRKEMNVRMSEICQRYDQDYWVWTPADFDLADTAKRAKALQDHEALYKACPRLDGIFIPGGDPGDNHPSLVLPFMKDLSVLLARHHPKAKVWLSLQGFRGDRAEYVYRFLDEEKPAWFGGIVCGPSSPSIPSTRKRLDPRYPIRSYPDITHNVRCQYPIPWWDTALAVTLGREAINPRPVQYAEIHNASAPYTAGFLSYSDGVHDDVNKVLWNVLAWNSDTPPREILIEYARFFFAPEVAETAADGILALEKNWIGSLRDNGGVDATLALWNGLEKQAPALEGNWRWQMCLVRAVYDAYTRHRLIYESALEEEANAKLAEAPTKGSQAAMAAATAVLRRAETEPVRPDLRKRIDKLCEALFRSIALQTSMSKYKASGAERGCILDFVDYPLNSRWWLEDEFKAIGALPSEPEKLARLELVRTWEHPGAGSFYDDVGNIAKSPHVVLGDLSPLGLRTARTPIPEVLWWDEGASRKRLAWMDVMNWPLAMHYTGLDPKADYVIRTTGFGTCLLSIDGERVRPAIDGKGIGEFKEFPVPKAPPGGRHIAPDVRTAGRACELAVSIEAVGTLAAEEVTSPAFILASRTERWPLNDPGGRPNSRWEIASSRAFSGGILGFLTLLLFWLIVQSFGGRIENDLSLPFYWTWIGGGVTAVLGSACSALTA